MIEVKLKGIPNESLVQGFPGIPATWPRIQGTVEVRPSPKALAKHAQASLSVSRVVIGLYRTDSISPHEIKASLASQKRDQSFLVTKQKELYKVASATDEVYALDLPFILSLSQSRSVVASLQLGKVVESVYYLFVTVGFDGKQPSLTRQFPIALCRFDTLPTFRAYQEPILGSAISQDHYVSLEYFVPTAAYGPLDQLRASFKISCNLDWGKARKARVKRISLELVQVIKFAAPPSDQPGQQGEQQQPQQLPSKKNPVPVQADRGTTMGDRALFGESSADAPKNKYTRIAKSSEDFGDRKIDEEPLTHELVIELPTHSFADKDNVYPKDLPEFPNEGRIGFTNASSLYSVEFFLKFKVRLSHAHDIESDHPITISQFGHNASLAYMQSIVDSAELAKYAERSAPRPIYYKTPIVRSGLSIQ